MRSDYDSAEAFWGLVVIAIGLAILGWFFQHLDIIFEVLFWLVVLWLLMRYAGAIVMFVILFAVSYFVASFFTPSPDGWAILLAFFGTAMLVGGEGKGKARSNAPSSQPPSQPPVVSKGASLAPEPPQVPRSSSRVQNGR